MARTLTSLLVPPKIKSKAKARPRLETGEAPAKPRPPRLAHPSATGQVRARPLYQGPDPVGVPAAGTWRPSYYSGLGEHGALRRMSYWLYLPKHAPATAPGGPGMPLIVMLHGCDQTATGFAEGTRMNQLAEAAGFAVVYPQQAVTTHPHRCWKWYDRATQCGGGDVPLIVGIVQTVIARHPIDPARVYICGISAGAGMANIVALNHPQLFAGLGLHSSPIFGAGHSAVGALSVMRHGAGSRVEGAIAEVFEKQPGFPSMPTILIQGEDDRVVRPINQAQLAHQAMLVNQLPPDSRMEVVLKVGRKRGHAYQLRDVYRGRKIMLRVARIAELQHAWSGGDERLSYNSASGPDASKMMINFFSRHRRAGA